MLLLIFVYQPLFDKRSTMQFHLFVNALMVRSQQFSLVADIKCRFLAATKDPRRFSTALSTCSFSRKASGLYL